MKSWRTTLFGVVTILSAVTFAAKTLLDGDPTTNPNWAELYVAIVAGIGLILARDQAQHVEDKKTGS